MALVVAAARTGLMSSAPAWPAEPLCDVVDQAGQRGEQVLLGTLATWGMTPPVVVADAAYGTNAHLRTALAERDIAYVLAIRADVTAHLFDTEPEAPERHGDIGCWPQPCYRHPAPSAAELAAGLKREALATVTWRQGSRGDLRSRFAAMRVRPAGKTVERPIRAAASAEQGWWDGILPGCWLLIDWSRCHRISPLLPATA
ncbi:transposase [Actinacidiphila glaucinigra]|uniref:transposase n=1 Tax=Actinacidiphila glaucinigra TaxID=235986 RepID=UPI0036E79196